MNHPDPRDILARVSSASWAARRPQAFAVWVSVVSRPHAVYALDSHGEDVWLLHGAGMALLDDGGRATIRRWVAAEWATEEEYRRLVRTLVRVQFDPDVHRPNPRGRYPVCKPALRSSTCERCGGGVQATDGPCPAVPPEERWGPDAEDDR